MIIIERTREYYERVRKAKCAHAVAHRGLILVHVGYLTAILVGEHSAVVIAECGAISFVIVDAWINSQG